MVQAVTFLQRSIPIWFAAEHHTYCPRCHKVYCHASSIFHITIVMFPSNSVFSLLLSLKIIDVTQNIPSQAFQSQTVLLMDVKTTKSKLESKMKIFNL